MRFVFDTEEIRDYLKYAGRRAICKAFPKQTAIARSVADLAEYSVRPFNWQMRRLAQRVVEKSLQSVFDHGATLRYIDREPYVVYHFDGRGRRLPIEETRDAETSTKSQDPS